MNETIFFAHIASLIGITLIAQRLGKVALACLSALQIVLANLFVTKQVMLFGLEVTATDAYTIGSLLCLNLYREVSTKEETVKLANINLFLLLVFLVLSLFQIGYLPSAADTAHTSFSAILATTPRICFASIFTYLISQRTDLWLFTRLRKSLSLPLSMILSLSISQAIDTVLFSYLGLYGVVSSMTQIIFFSYIIKLLALFSLSLATIFPKLGQQKKATK